MRRSLVKALLAAGSVGVLIAAASSCAAARAASEHTAQGGGAAGGGAAFYFGSILLGAPGAVAAALAGIGGWIGAWFFTPKAPPGAAPAGFPWAGLILVVLAVLAVRAWAHYPAMIRAAWVTVKATARGFLGGRTPSAPPPAGGQSA